MGAGNPDVMSRRRSQGAERRTPATRSVQPQAEQLQKHSRKEIEARLQQQELEEMKRQLEEKKSMVRATLNKARIALSQQQGKGNGQGKFEQSKEFLDAMEFLQCNKGFKFQPQFPLRYENANADVNSASVTPHPKPAKRGGPRESSLGFGPRAIARLYMPISDSRKRTEHDRAPKSIERCNSLGSMSSTTSRYMLPAATPRAQTIKSPRDEIRSSSKSVIVEIKERLRRREQQQQSGPQSEDSSRNKKDSILGKHEHWRHPKEIAREIVENARKSGFRKAESEFITQTKSLSTGKRISMMPPDMDEMDWTMSDGEESFLTPKTPFTDPTTPVRAKATTKKSSSTPLASESPRRGSVSATEIVTPRSSSKSKLDSPVATSKRNEAVMSNFARCRSVPNVGRAGYRTASLSESCEAINENNVTPRSSNRCKIDSPVSTCKRNEPAASNLARCRSVLNVGRACHGTASLSESCKAVNENNATSRGSNRSSLDSPVATSKRNEPATSSLARCCSVSNAGHGTASLSESREAVNENNATSRSSNKIKLDSPVATSKRNEPATSSLARCRSVLNVGRAGYGTASLAESCEAVNNRIHVNSSRNGGSVQGRDSSPRETKVRHVDREYREPCSSSAESPTLQQPRIQGSESPRSQQPRIQGSKSPRPQPLQAHQVQSEKKSPKHARVRKTARNILDDVDDRRDYKSGELSPGSVLELPCKEITNCLQDQLQIRSRRHKPDTSSQRFRYNYSSENIPGPPHQSPTTHHKINAESDFAFVRDTLVTSGFHTHGGHNLTRWYSPTQPLSHHLFLKVDSSHSRFQSSRSSHHRRMIFDAINEVLIAQLEAASSSRGAPCFGLPMIGSGNSGSSGRRFVEDVWRKIQRAMEMQGKGIEALVAEELPSSCRWLSVQRYVDRCCLQVETAIWNDLVEEVVAGFGASC